MEERLLNSYTNPLMKTVTHIQREKDKEASEAEMRQKLREEYGSDHSVTSSTTQLPLNSASEAQCTAWPTRRW